MLNHEKLGFIDNKCDIYIIGMNGIVYLILCLNGVRFWNM